MKQSRLFAFFLSLCLIFTMTLTPVLATDATSTTGSDQSQSDQSDTSDSNSDSDTSSDSDSESDSDSASDSDSGSDSDSQDETDSQDTDDSEDAAQEEESGPFSIDAGAALLIELNSDTVVYELNADKKIYPASLTKVMTCLVALELCSDLSEEVTVTESALADLDPDGVTVSLVPGEVLPMEELLYCMMLPSANDACTVVAEHLCGSIDAFVEKMNEKAAELGCTGTHFANPDGLHDDDHYTTARDLSIITRAALDNEKFRELCSTAIHEVPATNLSEQRTIYTTNYFMSTAITPDYYYEKATGVKTGYTSKAGRCLISTVKQGDFYYLSVVTGCKTINNDDGSVVYDNFVQTKKLLEYGLENFSFVTVLSKLAPVASIPVTDAAVDSVVIAPAEDLEALLPADYDETKLSTEYTLTNGGDTLQAPLEAGEDVGTITVYYDGKQIGQTAVRPITSVEKHKIEYVAKNATSQLKKYIGPIILVILLILVVLVVLRIRQVRKIQEARRRARKKSPKWDRD